jgi:predicted ArsR family transcriptional regulator
MAKKLQIRQRLLMLTKQFLDTTRGPIVTRLRARSLTVEEVATELGLAANAVRSQLTGMERDGLVRRAGQLPGTTRPSHVFELTSEVEQRLSRAYVPLLSQLIQTFAASLQVAELHAMLRETGRALGEALLAGRPASGSLRARLTFASQLLNDQLGALTHVEKNGSLTIRGAGCPLSALTGKHAGVCLAMESLVSTVVGEPVHECCVRDGRPRCCFEIGQGRAIAG